MERPNKYTFVAAFLPEAAGGYSVSFPQLDGCVTQGDSFEEALKMAQDAMSLHLYGMEEDGEKIPKADLRVQAGPNALSVPVTCWMTPFRDAMRNRAVRKTLTVPQWLNDEAEKAGVNFSQVLQNALKDFLGTRYEGLGTRE